MGEEKPKWYDEEKEMPQLWGWVIIILFSAAILGYGILTYLVVEDGPRQWSYGTLSDTPAESIYNSSVPDKPAKAPPQFTPLPQPTEGK